MNDLPPSDRGGSVPVVTYLSASIMVCSSREQQSRQHRGQSSGRRRTARAYSTQCRLWCGCLTVFPHPLLPTMMVSGRKNSIDSGAESEYDRTPWMDSFVIVVMPARGGRGQGSRMRASEAGSRKGRHSSEHSGVRRAKSGNVAGPMRDERSTETGSSGTQQNRPQQSGAERIAPSGLRG